MALLIVLGAVGLMLLAVWAWRSRGDARSLARHERAVTVLRGMADRPLRAPDVGEGGTGHVRVVDANPDHAFRPSTFWAGRPEPHGASVAHPIASLAAASTTGSAAPARRSPARRRAALVEAAVGTGIVAVIVLAALDRGATPTPGAGRPEIRRRPAPSSRPAPGPPAASATTVPVPGTQPVIASPLIADAHGAAYTVQGRYAVTVSATGSCWLRVRQGERGPVLYEGTLQHGDTRRFESGAPLWIRLGNAGTAAVELNGARVELPTASSTPFNVSFRLG
jgi:hypothetical protein